MSTIVDPDLVTRKMVLISADLRSLAPFAEKPLGTYLASATDEIDPTRVHEALQAAVHDVPEYLRQIRAYLSRLPASA